MENVPNNNQKIAEYWKAEGMGVLMVQKMGHGMERR
jgi:hypothetical protein